MEDNLIKKPLLVKDLIMPILVWVVIIIAFLNVKHIPFDLGEKDSIVLRYLIKFLLTIALPLGLIHLFYTNKGNFGIYFPRYSDSFKLALKAFSLAGPACMTFLLIGLFGWGFEDWPGSIILSIVFLVVLYFTPKRIEKLPNRGTVDIPNSRIAMVAFFGVLTLVVSYFTYEYLPVFSKLMYYTFIVAFGEELFFRGYCQSSINRYFGRPFEVAGVRFGWGLFLAAGLFGLSHAIVTVPPTWPWAIWTAILGITLGFLREKDGSILAAVILHALIDFPLAFMN